MYLVSIMIVGSHSYLQQDIYIDRERTDGEKAFFVLKLTIEF